jgi:hypothetical protein
MSDFVPEGYLPFTSAVDQACWHWFRDQINAAQERIKKQIEDKQAEASEKASPTDPVSRAIISNHLQETIKQMVFEACQEQIKETYRRLRNALHKGEITAVYFSSMFSSDEPTPIARGEWATSATDDVIKNGIYFPFGRQRAYYERPPSEQVLVREEELRRFLSGEASASDVKADQTATGLIAVSAAERYLTPHINLMLQAMEHFAISAARWPKKDALKAWFLTQKLPNGTPISPSQAEMMATFARPPEASRGGNKRS